MESHHIIFLASDGKDTVENVIALCPEHHREAHFGANADELAKMTDSPLYLLVEFMLEGIRQFLTFEQRLRQSSPRTNLVLPSSANVRRAPEHRDQYFAALEMLRAHLHRCLLQVSKIADIHIPKIADHMRYDEAWQLEAYEKPQLVEGI